MKTSLHITKVNLAVINCADKYNLHKGRKSNGNIGDGEFC